MKKIYLQITPFFPTNESFRGPYIYDQVKAIEQNSDYDIIVIKLVSYYEKVTEVVYNYQGIKVYNFKVLDLPSSVLPGLFQSYNLYRLKRFIKDVVKIDMNEVDIIHSHVTYPAGALAVGLGKEFKVKSFVQHHGLDVAQLTNGKLLKGAFNEWNNKFIKNRFLKTVNAADLNIGVSQKVIYELEKIEGFFNSNIYVLYNGVDATKFYRKGNSRKVDEFIIGCIGNFWSTKDQIILLKALNTLIQKRKILKVKFVGSGPILESCMNYVVKHNLKKYVDFIPEIDHIQLNDFYNTLDLFVLPSYYEAFGCVYAEALQVGIPIIAVKGQGIEEIIYEEDKKYFLMEQKNYTDLSKKILYLMETTHLPFGRYSLNIESYIKKFLEKVINL